jgi:hypothetical protein
VVDLRRLVGAVLIVAVLAVSPAAAQDAPRLVEAETYLDMFDSADLRGAEQPEDEIYDFFVEITGDPELDLRIRDAAEARGYVRRPVAAAELVTVDGRRLQASAAEAWVAMKAAARAEGVSLVMTSAHRDLGEQQSLFRQRLGGGRSAAAIGAALQTSAPPGYSKHHGGYALDIGQAGGTEAGFINTRAYAWLADYDFTRAKRFGFIPSYPVGGENMGPDPEAWEFVWVGAGRIACATGADLLTGFCDVANDDRLDDITWIADLGVTVGCAPARFCPDDPVTRGEAASLLWRLHGAPLPGSTAPFVDVFVDDHFGPAVDWLWGSGIVTGTSPDTFSPDDFLRPDEALALLVRLDGADGRPATEGLRGPIPDFAAGPLMVGDLGAHVSRAEFASVLRAAAVA